MDKHIEGMGEFAKECGSTAVCALIHRDVVYFANCGDSRAALYRNAMCHFSSKDHKPNDDLEKCRIEQANGFVLHLDGAARVNGHLAVSRALGDFMYKENTKLKQCQQLVSPEPDIERIQLLSTDANHQHDCQFIVLASDGIWDVMSCDEVGLFVAHYMKTTSDLTAICNRLLETCLQKVTDKNYTQNVHYLLSC